MQHYFVPKEVMRWALIESIGCVVGGRSIEQIKHRANNLLKRHGYIPKDAKGYCDTGISARIRDLLTGMYRKEREKNTGRAKVIRYWILPEKRLAA